MSGVSRREFVRRVHRELMVCKPNGERYGHLGMELAMAMARARAERVPMGMLKPRRVVNRAYLELEGVDLQLVRFGSVPSAALQAWWLAHDLRRSVWDGLYSAWLDLLEATRDQLRVEAADSSLDAALRRRIGAIAHALEDRHTALRARTADSTPYLLRKDIIEPVRIRLRPDVEARAVQQAERVGIPVDGPIVTLHAREAGYKRGREVQDKADFHLRKRPRDDSTRNVDIETFLPAADFLVSQGFTVVRIGDPSMVPVERSCVVDLATSPHRTPELEVYCLLRSAFLMGGESGPTVATYVTNTPTLTVNATDPISSFPIRSNWLYITKRVVDRESGEVLSLREMLTDRYLLHLRDTGRFAFIDNSPDEIVRAVKEMLGRVAGDLSESAEQREYRRLVTEAAETLKFKSNYIRKWGTHDGFLGNGAIGRFFADAYF